MRICVLTFPLILYGGCSTIDQGGAFDLVVHGKGEAGKGVLIIYADAAVEDGTVYFTRLKDKPDDKLFPSYLRIYPGTFIRILAEPGLAEIDTFVAWRKFLREPESPAPASRVIGHEAYVEAGDVLYFTFRQEVEEVYRKCEETRETTTICKMMSHSTIIEPVDGSVAVKALSGLVERI